MAKSKSVAIDPIKRMPELINRYAYVEHLASVPSVFAPGVTIGYYEHEKPNRVEHPTLKGGNPGGSMKYFGGE